MRKIHAVSPFPPPPPPGQKPPAAVIGAAVFIGLVMLFARVITSDD